jgi:hypothetical protein
MYRCYEYQEISLLQEDLILSRDHLAALFNRAPTGYAALEDKGLINETLGKILHLDAAGCWEMRPTVKCLFNRVPARTS